jgi:hypothetical protein
MAKINLESDATLIIDTGTKYMHAVRCMVSWFCKTHGALILLRTPKQLVSFPRLRAAAMLVLCLCFAQC